MMRGNPDRHLKYVTRGLMTSLPEELREIEKKKTYWSQLSAEEEKKSFE